MSIQGEGEAFFRHTVAPMMDVIAGDVRWHCTRCQVDGVGRDSFNAHATDHIPDEEWRSIGKVRLDSVSFVDEPLHPSWTVQRVPTRTWSMTVPVVKVDRHRLARLLGVWCTDLGAPWHPGCRELPRRSRMHAAYHRRNR